MTEPPRLPVEPGEVLAGKYRVERVLGSGAMGIVVAATHVHLEDQVAIKFLLPSAMPSAQAIERFAREARATVKIKSEHVVRVLDVGTFENGSPYMVMEYLDGQDLSVWLAERGTVSIEQAVDFLVQASEAIAEAHALGIVHRDLKPANLFVLTRGDGSLMVKVLDFGISKLTGKTTGSNMTQTSVVMGSPFYMSPEQLRSTRDVDHRADIWALGVILYELIAGKPPFEGDSMPELVHRTVYEPPIPLRDARPDAPAGLEEVILKALAKNADDRYQSVAEFAAALVQHGSEQSRFELKRISGFSRLSAATLPSQPAPNLPPSGRPSPMPSSAISAPSVTTDTGAVKAEAPPSWSLVRSGPRRLKAAGIALGAVGLVAVAWVLLRAPLEASPPASPAPVASERITPTEMATGAEVPRPVAPVIAVDPVVPTASSQKADPPVATGNKKPHRAGRAAPPVPVVPVASAKPAPSAPPPAASEAPKKPSLDSLIDDRK